MKKFTLLLMLLLASFGFSQDLLLGFEDGESGGVNGDPFGGMPAPTLVTGTGSNTSQVLEIVGNTSGEPWQGANINLTSDVDLTSTQTMTIDVQSATPITFLVKVGGGVSGAPEAAAEVTHNGDGTWQTLSFTFDTALDGKAAAANGIYTAFVIHAYWEAGETTFFPDGTAIATPARTFYVDNIKGPMSTVETCNDGIMNNGETGIDCGGPNCSACPTPPTVAAPTPPARPAADVISLYSDAYADVSSNFDAGWCGASSVEEVMIEDNPTMAYKNNACQGIVLDAGVDASTFTNLHVDIYIQGGTDLIPAVFNLKFVQQPGGGALEINLNAGSTPALVAGSWLPVDIPVDLATFTGFKEFGITSNLQNVVWYDNLYVHKNTILGVNDNVLVELQTYPNPTKGNWTVKNADIEMQSIRVFDALGKSVLTLTPNNRETIIDGSSLKSGLYFAQIKTANGIGSIKLIKN